MFRLTEKDTHSGRERKRDERTHRTLKWSRFPILIGQQKHEIDLIAPNLIRKCEITEPTRNKIIFASTHIRDFIKTQCAVHTQYILPFYNLIYNNRPYRCIDRCARERGLLNHTIHPSIHSASKWANERARTLATVRCAVMFAMITFCIVIRCFDVTVQCFFSFRPVCSDDACNCIIRDPLSVGEISSFRSSLALCGAMVWFVAVASLQWLFIRFILICCALFHARALFLSLPCTSLCNN